MRRPSPAILGSIALHGGVVALALISWPKKDEEKPLISSVPVTIVSEMVIAAAPADNPAPEPSPEDGATAPVEVPPAPTPPTPTPPAPTPPAPTPPKPTPPRPTPPRPTPPAPKPEPKPEPAPRPAPRPTPAPAPKAEPKPPAPAPRPTPAPPAKTNPAPSRPTPAPPAKSNPAPAPAPARPQPGLDLDSLAGPARPTQNRGRPATGQQGSGSASQATGPQLTAIFNQVYPHWTLNCDIPGANDLRIQFELTLSSDGRITKGPTLVNGQSSAVYRAAADNALRALRQAAPFDVPSNFPGGEYRPTFNTERACANR